LKFCSTEMSFGMNARWRNFLFGMLMLAAFAAAGYKIFTRAPSSTFAAVAVDSVPALNKPSNAGQAPRLEAHFVSSVPGQAVHAPSLVELKDGSLRAVWFSGSREGAGDVTVQTAVMRPASQRWEAETTLFDRAKLERGLWRYVKKIGNPVIARAPDASLHLWMVNVSLGGWAGSAITWARSVDEGATWSAPRRLVTSPFLNISTLVKGAPVAMADGSVSLPAYHEFVTKFAEVVHLNARGEVTDKTRIPGSQTGLQPVMLVANAGDAQAYMRAGVGGKVLASSTSDAGETWAQTRPTGLVNPDSSLAGLVGSKGEKWLALNPSASGRLSLALLKADSAGSFAAAKLLFIEGLGASPSSSENSLPIREHAALLGRELKAQGASDADVAAYVASAARQLCGAGSCAQEFSYPYLLQTRDGSLHLVYTWHRSRIKHVRLDHAALD
jgi:predicted neuraminidase